MSDQASNPLDYHNPRHAPPRGPTAKSVILWTFGSFLGIALLMSLLLPSLGRARETAQRVKCASNLKQIGQAIFLYASENRGAMVPDWPTLLTTQALGPGVFICPSSELDKAPGAASQIAQNLLEGDHLSYVLVGGVEKLSNSPDEILAFDLDKHVPKDAAVTTGINVLFADGHVQFVDEMIAKAIRARYYAGVRPIRLSECLMTPAGTTQPS